MFFYLSAFFKNGYGCTKNGTGFAHTLKDIHFGKKTVNAIK
jgi:hypothetical protein